MSKRKRDESAAPHIRLWTSSSRARPSYAELTDEETDEEEKKEDQPVPQLPPNLSETTDAAKAQLLAARPHPMPTTAPDALLCIRPAVTLDALLLHPKGLAALSRLQVRTCMEINACHSQILPGAANSVFRRAFLLAFSTGVGKTRVMAATFAHNWCKWQEAIANNRHSTGELVSKDGWRGMLVAPTALVAASFVQEWASCGFGALPGMPRPVSLGNTKLLSAHMHKGTTTTDLKQADSFIVTTYNLVARLPAALTSRWLGSNPRSVLCLDESHTIRNKPAHELLTQTLRARLVLSSATSFERCKDLAYLWRTGVLGATSVQDMAGFNNNTNKQKENELTMALGMAQLRMAGAFTSEALSLDDVSVLVESLDLSPAQRAMMEDVQLVLDALKWVTIGKQRTVFIKRLLAGCKCRNSRALMRRLVEEDRSSLIVTIMYTKQHNTKERLEIWREFTSDFPQSKVLPARPASQLFYDLARALTDARFMSSQTRDRARELLLGDRLLDALPGTAVEEMYRTFDPKIVAELSSRSCHLDGVTGKVHRTTRAAAFRQFSADRRKVCLMTRGSSSGICLHAKTARSRRRELLFLEHTGSAIDMVQQFGRVFRADQHLPPKYRLLCTRYESRYTRRLLRRLRGLRVIGSNHPALAALRNTVTLDDCPLQAFLLVFIDWVLGATTKWKGPTGRLDRTDSVKRALASLKYTYSRVGWKRTAEDIGVTRGSTSYSDRWMVERVERLLSPDDTGDPVFYPEDNRLFWESPRLFRNAMETCTRIFTLRKHDTLGLSHSLTPIYTMALLCSGGRLKDLPTKERYGGLIWGRDPPDRFRREDRITRGVLRVLGDKRDDPVARRTFCRLPSVLLEHIVSFSVGEVTPTTEKLDFLIDRAKEYNAIPSSPKAALTRDAVERFLGTLSPDDNDLIVRRTKELMSEYGYGMWDGTGTTTTQVRGSEDDTDDILTFHVIPDESKTPHYVVYPDKDPRPRLSYDSMLALIQPDIQDPAVDVLVFVSPSSGPVVYTRRQGQSHVREYRPARVGVYRQGRW